MADVKINDLAAASSVTDAMQFEVDTAGTTSEKITAAQLRTYMGILTLATADTTYFVRTDGNNANLGTSNTSGGAFATIQKALDVVAAIGWFTFKPTIQVGAGTWTVPVVLPPVLTSTIPELIGDTTTPSNVTISVSGTGAICIHRPSPGCNWRVRGFRLQSTGLGAGNLRSSFGAIEAGNIVFNGNSSTGFDYMAINFGLITWIGNYSVTASGSVHAWAQPFGSIYLSGATVTLSGTPAMSGFWFYGDRGQIDAFSVTFTGSGGTGTRYRALGSGGNIFVNGGGLSYLPGSLSGSIANGGEYY